MNTEWRCRHGWLRGEQCEVCKEIERLTTERDTLRTFAKWVMESWPDGGIDGFDLQDKAVELGLLKLTTPTGPCGEECTCNWNYNDEYFREGQVKCYRRTALLTGEQA